MKQEKILYGGLASLNRELKAESWQNAKFLVLVDENTFENCLQLLVSKVDVLQEASLIEVPIGEECKSLDIAVQVWRSLLEENADRQTVIVNLGGGTVCDLGGFVAAGYKRGLRYINVPTTLLSMVDAAIGGKTAINFDGVKNSVGFFYPAIVTVIEPMFLDTLPQEYLRCGLVEMVKTAIVSDGVLYKELIAASSVSPKSIKAVTRIKTQVVKLDPYDFGVRKILNFGHTFGHAIEVYSGLPHGLAVGIGMRVAMYLSVRKIGLSEATYRGYCKWLEALVEMPHYSLKDVEKILALMHKDKKATNSELRCVLLKEIGAAVIDVAVSDNEVRDALLKL